MSKLTPQTLGGLLIAWNITFGILWIGLSEVRPVTRASAKYGHIANEEGIALMRQDREAGWKEVRPYYPIVVMLVGVNCVLAVLLLRRLGQQSITRPDV